MKVLFYSVLLWSALSEILNSLLSYHSREWQKEPKSCHVRTAERAAAVQPVEKQPQRAEHMTKALSPHWPGWERKVGFQATCDFSWKTQDHWMGAWRDAYPFPSPLSGSMKGCISLFSWPEAKTPGDTLLFGKCHALSKIGSRNCAGAETWLSEAVMFPTLWAALGSCEEILLISVFWGLFSRLHLLLASLSFFQQDVSMPSFTLVWDFCIKC